MKKEWPKVRLGDVLRRSQETVELQADREYTEVTVRLWGNGVVERRRVMGTDIAGARRFVTRTDQFIASRIDARNGAMGIVPKDLDGAVVTNDFPLFSVNADRMLPDYLGWLCRTAGFVDLCSRASEGTTNRVRLKEERFVTLEIPLPPLAEQRRLVARIDEVAAQIHEARTLREQAAAEAEAISHGGVEASYQRLLGRLGAQPLADVCDTITDGDHNTPIQPSARQVSDSSLSGRCQPGVCTSTTASGLMRGTSKGSGLTVSPSGATFSTALWERRWVFLRW